MIAEVIYALCALASIVCAVMLLRGYQQTKTNLLLWTTVCFIGLAVNNAFLFVDMVVFPDTDMFGSLIRNVLGAVSGGVLLIGLIWELT